MEKYTFKEIKTKDLDAEFPYGTRFSSEDPALEACIKATGFIMPLIVVGEKPYRLISGRRRLEAAAKNGYSAIPAFILKKNIADKDAFLLAILSNLNTGWNDYDRVRVIRKALEEFGCSKQELIEIILPVLALPASEHMLQTYYRVSKLSSELLSLLAARQLPVWAAASLCLLTPEDQDTLLKAILEKLAFTASELRDITEWLVDLVKKEGLPLRAYLESQHLIPLNIRETLSRNELKTEGRRFLADIRKRRFPRMARYQNRFHEISRTLYDGSGGFKLEAPESFENEGFRLHIRAKNSKDLDHALNLIREKQRLLNSLFDIKL